MRRPAPDGSTHLVLTPLALLKELAALIPPPRVHHLRFHGVFGPAARLRPSVTALAKPELPPVQEHRPEGGPTGRRTDYQCLVHPAGLQTRLGCAAQACFRN